MRLEDRPINTAPVPAGTVALLIKKSHDKFRAGEIAGFAPDHAAHLLKLGYAAKATEQEMAAYDKRLRTSPAAPEHTLVKFDKRWGVFMVGEQAAVPSSEVEWLVNNEIATRVEGKAETETVKIEPEPLPAVLFAKAMDAPIEDRAVLSPAAKKALGR